MTAEIESRQTGILDPFFAEEELSTKVQLELEKRLMLGHTPFSAAKEIGVSRATIRRWMDNEIFCEWVMQVKSEYFGTVFSDMNKWVYEIAEEDKKTATKLMIEHMAHLNKEYGSKHSTADVSVGQKVVSPGAKERIAQIKEDTKLTDSDIEQVEDAVSEA